MTAALIGGLAAATLLTAGLLMLARALFAPPVPLRTFHDGSYRRGRQAVSAADGPIARAQARATAALSPSAFVPTRLRADMRLLDKTDEAHMVERLLLGGLGVGVAFIATLIIQALILRAAVPLPVTLLLAGAVGYGGWVFPNLAVADQASTKRKEFLVTFASYLDLVRLLIGASDGPERALRQAATLGNGWTVDRIRQYLSVAEGGATIRPWEALGQLGVDYDIREVREFASSMEQTATSATLPLTLAKRAEALRRKVLRGLEGDAKERTERLDLPNSLMTIVIMAFFFYGAISQAGFGQGGITGQLGSGGDLESLEELGGGGIFDTNMDDE